MTIVDHVGGLEDLQAKHIRTIAPPAVSFAEDPVRMLRAIRFQVRLGFTLDAEVAEAIGRQADTLRQVTRHRLADETQRFLTSGFAQATLTEFDRRGLLLPLLSLEKYAWFFAPEAVAHPLKTLGNLLERLDRWSAEGREPLAPTVVLLGVLVKLARPEFRAYITASPVRGQAPSGSKRAPVDSRTIRKFKRDLPAMLLDWGLLRGQVEPGLRILGAVRLLLRQADPGQGQAHRARRAPQIGEREAWLLLGIVGPDLGADPATVQEGLARLHELPDLPILDHPRPVKRGASKIAAPLPDFGRSPEAGPRGPARRRGRRRAGSRHRQNRPTDPS
jgi:hypothetical protein